MPRPARTAPRKRQAPEVSSFTLQDSRILSQEEKHELIRAHTAARHARPEKMGLGYYVAVAASFLIVATGWVYTFDRGLWNTPQAPDPAVQQLQDNAERLKIEWQKAKARAALPAATSTDSLR